MIPDAEFNDKLMENPGNLKKFIDAHRKSLEAQAEMKSAIDLFTKS
jgi:hypothetical protein